MLYVLDQVTAEIVEAVLLHPPERGGAVLGIPGRDVVTRFVFDAHAECTHGTFVPSTQLAARVRAIEEQDGLEFKGILHSHPGLDRPSAQDARELKVGLRLNPHLPAYLAPIATAGTPQTPLGAHELAAGPGKISFYGASPRRGERVLVRPVAVCEVPISRDLERVSATYGGAKPEVFLSRINGMEMLAGQLRLDGLELLMLATELYPVVPPILLLTPADAETMQVDITWPLRLPASERLLHALDSVIERPAPYAPAFGPKRARAVTRDPALAALAGWSLRYTGAATQAVADEIGESLFARSAGLLARSLTDRRVLVAGCGSVGSYLAEQLVRSGIGSITLVDPDAVEPPNLSRSVYDLSDVGRPKVEALARRLLNINPTINVELRKSEIGDLGSAELNNLVSANDLVVGATDDARAQLAVNRFAYARQVPAVFVGLYAGAAGGEVIVSTPPLACYGCATSVRHQDPQAVALAPGIDYGTGRLAGEVAIGADIHHVCTAAAKLALSLLVADEEARLAGFATPILQEGTTYLTMSMTSEFWFYPQVFGQTPGQYAYQAVWVQVTPSPDCPTCGAPAMRAEPLELPLRADGPRVAVRQG
jgi:molybdopterin/thiamine biosynthesis adenylyltransferase